MKKICIIYANCQNKLIGEYLNQSSVFNQEYQIHRFPVHLLMEQQSTVPTELLQQAKLFIYQPVKTTHGDRASDFILQQLPDDCRCISFPSLYFGGYFPQYCKNPVNKIIKPNHPFGIFPYGDKNIISLLAENKSETEIIEILSNPDFYSAEYLLANLHNTLAELERRESELSIKVSSFLREHYRQYYLFHTSNHPTDIIGIYIVNQILELLNFPSLGNPLAFNNPTRGILDGIQIPLYPSVIKHLNLTFVNENSHYKNTEFSTNQMTFDRYISEYIYLHLSTQGADIHEFKSINLAKKNKLPEAITELKKAIKLKDNNASYYGELASIFLKQNNFDDAEYFYQKAISLSPDWLKFYLPLGEILTKKNDLSGACLIYQKALELNPNNAELLVLIGDLMFKQNKLEQAESCYQQAIDLKPNTSFYYRRLGDVFNRKEKFNLAISNYRKAINLSPKTAYFYIHLGGSLAKQNKLDEALKSYQQAIELNPENPNFHYILGNTQLKKGDVDEAFASYQQAIQLNPQQMNKIFSQISVVIKEKNHVHVNEREPQLV
jgi:tetratricopeptide (TPR) repeat protein